MNAPVHRVSGPCDHDCLHARLLPGGDAWSDWLWCARPGSNRRITLRQRDCPAFTADTAGIGTRPRLAESPAPPAR
jgi:hypothetical protein